MKLKIGFSPCPNDTFMFHAMLHGEVDTEGLEFEPVIRDVEQLNQMAFKQELDITKLSYYAYAFLSEHYILLTSGSALGKNCGPLLVGKNAGREHLANISNLTIAIPGKYTTANFLLSLAFPQAKNKVEMNFGDIPNAVLNGEVDLGLLIHESRFTYEKMGLNKLADLGEFWESVSNAPIPLGGIAIKRSIDPEVAEKVDRVLRKSIEFAFRHPLAGIEFVREHAQEMENEVMFNHIKLYVNDFSLSLGKEGKNAVKLLMEKALKTGIVPAIKEPLFTDYQYI